MDERDRRAHRAVARAFVYQPEPMAGEGFERVSNVVHPVANMVQPLATAFEEPANRGVRPKRLDQLDIRRPGRCFCDVQHGFSNALVVVDLAGHHGEPERRLVEGHFLVKIAAGDTDVIDSCEHGRSVSSRYRGCMPGSVIVAGARTPIGRLLGSLDPFSAVQLGGFAIEEALRRAGVTGDQVDYVIMGHVLQAGAGQITARQAAYHAGIPLSVPALTVNKVCLSGLDAIALADQLIGAGEFEIVVAGGMESMTNAPHVLPGSRRGYKYGSLEVLDAMAHDGLTCAFDGMSMGESTERRGARLGSSAPTREEQDEYAALSHQRAAAARKEGAFDEEIVSVEVPRRRGEPLLVDQDEGIRPETTVETLAALPPAFGAEGTITAGSSSQISDGGCAVVVMSRRKAEELGAPMLAEVGAHGVVAGPDPSLHSQPANAIRRAGDREGLDVGDLDLVEINEAFAAVVLRSMRELGIGIDRVNPNGGAIALGHPIGMSGARILLTLALELKRRGGGIGAAGLCGGGGQGDGLIIRVPA